MTPPKGSAEATAQQALRNTHTQTQQREEVLRLISSAQDSPFWHWHVGPFSTIYTATAGSTGLRTYYHLCHMSTWGTVLLFFGSTCCAFQT